DKSVWKCSHGLMVDSDLQTLVSERKGSSNNNSCFNHQESTMDAEFEDERKKKRKEAADSKQKEKKEEADMAAHFLIYAKIEDPHEDIRKLDGDKAMISWDDDQEMKKSYATNQKP
nr:hypothetical protein [Tanacetum cinerariifolium]